MLRKTTERVGTDLLVLGRDCAADFDEPPALQLEVADAGPGIPRELLPRLFTRGARGSGGTESTHGLGLYIVRRVMDMHGGRAELLRTGPLGTVMRLTLPQAD